jgi:hypothetical protein
LNTTEETRTASLGISKLDAIGGTIARLCPSDPWPPWLSAPRTPIAGTSA